MNILDTLLGLVGRQTEPELEKFSAFDGRLSLGELNAIRDKAFVDGDTGKASRAFEISQNLEKPAEAQIPAELAQELINPPGNSNALQKLIGVDQINTALRTQPGG